MLFKEKNTFLEHICIHMHMCVCMLYASHIIFMLLCRPWLVIYHSMICNCKWYSKSLGKTEAVPAMKEIWVVAGICDPFPSALLGFWWSIIFLHSLVFNFSLCWTLLVSIPTTQSLPFYTFPSALFISTSSYPFSLLPPQSPFWVVYTCYFLFLWFTVTPVTAPTT